MKNKRIEQLQGKLIVSCQALPHEPLHSSFIMGRSVNSRNRVFVTEGEGIRTQAFDPAKLTDPSLVIYAPGQHEGGHPGNPVPGRPSGHRHRKEGL